MGRPARVRPRPDPARLRVRPGPAPGPPKVAHGPARISDGLRRLLRRQQPPPPIKGASADAEATTEDLGTDGL